MIFIINVITKRDNERTTLFCSRKSGQRFRKRVEGLGNPNRCVRVRLACVNEYSMQVQNRGSNFLLKWCSSHGTEGYSRISVAILRRTAVNARKNVHATVLLLTRYFTSIGEEF